MQLLDGKKVASELYQKLQGKVAALKEKNIFPKLVIVLVGDDPASLSYIKQKRKASEQTGILSELINLKPEEVTTQSMIDLVNQLNADASVHGFIIQLPLPKHVDTPKVLKAVNPKKDVDGFTAYNLGKMFLSTEFEDLAPCTPLGVIRLLEYYEIAVKGLEVTMVGSSNTVGKPLAIMLQNRGATVTICNSKTKDLAAHTRRADILIVAVGKIGLITREMVKEDAVVVDVGINRNEEGKLVGDVDFDGVSEVASFITPVPGGCGPMTVGCLMENVVRAVLQQNPQFVS
ncbi:MAG: bifunctional 5,10-methylenetetrahydrofolate dehydrogenase/5,10-methenyltetrahydrofolate cyclohydrolase [Candidatus Gracilibacteria bacterium]